jgi:hypothetical protein
MAHFALIDDNNIVVQVLVVPNEQQHRGEEFLATDLGLGGRWIQTSYNTRFGIYINPETNTPDPDQTKAFRYHYAGIGMKYDQINDRFVFVES